MKKTQIFFHEPFYVFVIAGMFLELVLFLETLSGCTPGGPQCLPEKGNFWVLDIQDSWNIHCFNDFML